jgi:hypothetical protein
MKEHHFKNIDTDDADDWGSFDDQPISVPQPVLQSLRPSGKVAEILNLLSSSHNTEDLDIYACDIVRDAFNVSERSMTFIEEYEYISDLLSDIIVQKCFVGALVCGEIEVYFFLFEFFLPTNPLIICIILRHQRKSNSFDCGFENSIIKSRFDLVHEALLPSKKMNLPVLSKHSRKYSSVSSAAIAAANRSHSFEEIQDNIRLTNIPPIPENDRTYKEFMPLDIKLHGTIPKNPIFFSKSKY